MNLVLLHHESSSNHDCKARTPYHKQPKCDWTRPKRGFAQEVFQVCSNHKVISLPHKPAGYTPSVFLVQAYWLTVLAVMIDLHLVSQCYAAKLLHQVGVGISIKC